MVASVRVVAMLIDADGMITLDAADVQRLLPDQSASTPSAVADADETFIYGNITEGQARIMTGDVGVEKWQRAAGRKTTITHNKFGKDAKIMTGNVGGAAAESFFNSGFWN